MKPRLRFLSMWDSLPNKAKRELVFYDVSGEPRSIQVIVFEVKGYTKLGEKLLKQLGYMEDY